jgi:Tfp pilus assembly protein PilW
MASFMLKIKCIYKNISGVSLLEMVVAISIFAIMILSATAIFQMVMDSQRSAVAAQNTQESIRYLMEVISKEIRSAERDGGSCPNVPDNRIYAVSTNAYGDILYLKNYLGQCVSYSLNAATLMITRGANTAATTPGNINVNNLKFIADEDPTIQPKVTISMDAEAVGKALSKQKIKVQTTLSSRYYD